jgi:hypothetical protein
MVVGSATIPQEVVKHAKTPNGEEQVLLAVRSLSILW